MQSVARSAVANQFMCPKLRQCSVPVQAACKCVASTGRRLPMGVPWLRSGLAASSSSTTAPSPAEPSQGKMPCSVAARSYSSFRSLCFFHVRLGIANRTLGCRLEMCHNWDTWNFWPQRPLWAPGYHSPENRRFALVCLTQHIASQ